MMLDHDTKRFRPSTLADLYDVARIVDTLDNIHVFVRTLVARDMETARELDINTAYAILAGTSKPLGTAMFQPDHVHECVDLFDMALGAEGEFARRPFSIANNTFVVPPLRFAEDSALCLMEQARRGMPINLLSAGQAGATSPAALAGSLVQASGRVPGRADRGEPGAARPSLRAGHVAVRVRPAHWGDERGQRRGGDHQRRRRPGGELLGPCRRAWPLEWPTPSCPTTKPGPRRPTPSPWPPTPGPT